MNNAKSIPPTNVMIDLETLGLKPGAVILSIGATTFWTGEDPRDMFYQKISKDSCLHAGMHTLASTMAWWNKQDPAVREEALSGVDSITDVLLNFSGWLRGLNNTVVVWGNAASFDLKLLERAYELLGIPVPWNYRNEMCFRTLKNLYEGLVPATAFLGARHNALDDAVNQANHAEAIFKFQQELHSLALAKQLTGGEECYGNDN